MRNPAIVALLVAPVALLVWSWTVFGAVAFLARLAGGVRRIGHELLSPRGRTLRAARRASRTPIRDAGEGSPILIVGTIRFYRGALEARLTGRRCCFYQARFDEPIPKLGFGVRNSWSMSTEEKGCDFILEDGTGKALVRIDSAVSFDYRGSALKSGTSEAHEWALEEGTRVAVYGVGEWEADPAPDWKQPVGYRDAPRRLVVRAPRGLHLLLSDHLVARDPSALGPTQCPAVSSGSSR